MSEQRICVNGCGVPPRNMELLCVPCQAELRQALAEMPAWLEQLEVSYTRMSRLTNQRGGKPTKTKSTPLLFDVRTADVLGQIRIVFTGWARVLIEDCDQPMPADDLVALSRFLLARIDLIAKHDAAADIQHEIVTAYEAAKRAVDRPPDKLWAGRCGKRTEAITEPGDGLARGGVGHWECDEDVYAKAGSPYAVCVGCGERYNADERRQAMANYLEDSLYTAAEIASLAMYLLDDLTQTRDQTRKQINQWHKRGLLVRHQDNQIGEPMFRFGDAKTLIGIQQAKREQREAERQAS
jgi:hypothetical protein